MTETKRPGSLADCSPAPVDATATNAAPVRLLHVCAARPNFMKIAPLMAAADAWSKSAARSGRPSFAQTLVHTDQHYDASVSQIFFQQLGLSRPDYHLGVGSGSHAVQTANVLERLESVLVKERPHLVVVVGDVNSTVAAALCAAKLGVPVAHVEAGLRSGDRTMPEEINRVLTDQLAELLFTTERSAGDNLAREGIDATRVHFVGNTMIDTLERLLKRAREGDALDRMRLTARSYGLVTLHRPSNVDDEAQLRRLVATLRRISQQVKLVWPVHPRTRSRLGEARHVETTGSGEDKAASPLMLTEPLGYLDFLQLMDSARVVLTDSGGIQEETTVLGVPCLTLRITTERPVTIHEGTNRLVDPSDAAAILGAVDDVLAAPMPAGVRPDKWDGHAAERIVAVIADWARSNG